MKKVLLSILAIILMFSLTGCDPAVIAKYKNQYENREFCGTPDPYNKPYYTPEYYKYKPYYTPEYYKHKPYYGSESY
ncbi:hypothetical protein ACFL21_03865 [Patescibacteria group bacterium]